MRGWIWVAVLAGCTGTDETPEPIVADAVGSCVYVNSFSQTAECKEYIGGAWNAGSAGADCEAPMPGAAPGDFTADVACDRTQLVAECVVDAGSDVHTVLVFSGDDASACEGLDIGCSFAGGEYIPTEVCDGGDTTPVSGSVFQPFEQICMDPLDDTPGQSADGQVCTWQAISGATEEGRYFADYASCDAVLTQRPYWPAAVTANTPSDDPRLSDADWMAEYDWVTDQVRAAACVCCHTEAEAPSGKPSGWYLEAAPIWTDTLDDDAMAMLAGWVDSTVFGAFPAEENNGFERDETGIPTTDSARMKAFWTGELARRGLGESDFVDTEPFGGPLYDQLQYEPSACAAGEGVAADGTVTWAGGGARYVYVLEPGSFAPGVPPNLDLPEGTVWRLDVDFTADPVSSGIGYGDAPSGTRQVWPTDDAAPALVSGQTYYLYVLQDVYIPITRCLFTAE